MTTAGNIYNFKSDKTLEQFCTDIIRIYSNKFKDVYKPYLMSADKESNTAGVPLTVEEKVAINLDFENRKIKKVYRSEDLRIIIIESEDPELEFEFVDSLANNTIITTLITNGLKKDIDLESDGYINFIAKYAQHMVITNLAKAGLEYSTGDEVYVNGIIGLSFGSSFSSFYVYTCALLSIFGIIQLLTPQNIGFDKIQTEEDEMYKEELEKLWNGISEAEYVINNIPDKTICDYISFKTSMDRVFENLNGEDTTEGPEFEESEYNSEEDDDFYDESGEEISSLEELSLEEIDDTKSGELEDSDTKEE